MRFIMQATSQAHRLTPIPVRNVLTGLVGHNYKHRNRGRNYASSRRKISTPKPLIYFKHTSYFGEHKACTKSAKLNISPYAFYTTHNLHRVCIILYAFL
jgi:hypothetical protein